MRDHARYAAVQINEGVNPDEPVMRAGNPDDGTTSPLHPVHLVYVGQEPWHGPRAGRDVIPDANEIVPKRTRLDRHDSPVKIMDDTELLGCPIPDDRIDPLRSGFFMARSVLRDIRKGVRPC